VVRQDVVAKRGKELAFAPNRRTKGQAERIFAGIFVKVAQSHLVRVRRLQFVPSTTDGCIVACVTAVALEVLDLDGGGEVRFVDRGTEAEGV